MQLQIIRNKISLFGVRMPGTPGLGAGKVVTVLTQSPNDHAPSKGCWRRERERPSLSEVFGSIRTRPTGSFWNKLVAFLGPGYLVAVGYMDPGNWATSLAGGSKFGYALLTVALLSNLMAILLQALCARLGIGASTPHQGGQTSCARRRKRQALARSARRTDSGRSRIQGLSRRTMGRPHGARRYTRTDHQPSQCGDE